MSAPYFSTDDDIIVMGRLKLLFLIKRLRNIDIGLIFLWIVPVAYLIFIKGENNIGVFFSTLPLVFGYTSFTISAGFVVFCSIILIRFFASRMILLQMKRYEEENSNFSWNKKSIYFLFMFIPFLSFTVYKNLLQFNKSEISYKYNL